MGWLRLKLLPNRFPALHGLRVLAILAVIQVHFSTSLTTSGLLASDSFLHQLSKHLWFSMDVFFFLSGFLIGTILMSERQLEAGARGYLAFYLRRSFRIVPAYYVVLTVLACLHPLDYVERHQLPFEYLYLTNYLDLTHTVMLWGWSLCVEEHFYLAVPLIVLGLTAIPWHELRIAALLALWLAGAAVRWGIVLTTPGLTDPVTAFEKLYIPTHARFDILIAGVLLAYLFQTEGERFQQVMKRPRVRATGVAIAVGLAVLLATDFTGRVPMTLALGTLTGIGLFCLCAVLTTAAPESPAVRVLGHPMARNLATLGYGVYLVHYPIVYALGPALYRGLHGAGLPTPLAFAVGPPALFVATLPVACALHLLIEKPALALRDRFVPRG